MKINQLYSGCCSLDWRLFLYYKLALPGNINILALHLMGNELAATIGEQGSGRGIIHHLLFTSITSDRDTGDVNGRVLVVWT